jgi:hypothetical protein
MIYLCLTQTMITFSFAYIGEKIDPVIFSLSSVLSSPITVLFFFLLKIQNLPGIF